MSTINHVVVVLTKPQHGEKVIASANLSRTKEDYPGWKELHKWDMPSRGDALRLSKYLAQNSEVLRSFIKYDPVIVPGRRYAYHLLSAT